MAHGVHAIWRPLRYTGASTGAPNENCLPGVLWVYVRDGLGATVRPPEGYLSNKRIKLRRPIVKLRYIWGEMAPFLGYGAQDGHPHRGPPVKCLCPAATHSDHVQPWRWLPYQVTSRSWVFPRSASSQPCKSNLHRSLSSTALHTTTPYHQKCTAWHTPSIDIFSNGWIMSNCVTYS